MKVFFSIILIFVLALSIKAQTPQGINYQGVARNSAGQEVFNQNIGIQFSIRNGSASGTIVYTETHATTTDPNGLFSLVIGNGTPTSGTFSSVDWASGSSKWLEVSMDITGGTSYQLMGSSQLMSVPYALYAGKVTNTGGKSILILTDSITDSQAAAMIAAEVGANTHQIIVDNCVNLTTLDLSSVKNVQSIQVTNNPLLSSINLNGLKRSFGKIKFMNCPQLTSLSFPSLKTISDDGLWIETTGVTSISAPVLDKNNGYLQIVDNANLTSVSFPLLSSTLLFRLSYLPSLTSIDFTSLFTTSQFDINYISSITSMTFPSLAATGPLNVGSTSLVTISFPALVNTQQISVTYNQLTSISAPLLNMASGLINLVMNKLPVSEVDSWLEKVANISQMNIGSINSFYSFGQTPAAPPSVTGQGYVSTLLGLGVTVLTD